MENKTVIDFILLSIENEAYTYTLDDVNEGKFRMSWDKLDKIITEAKEKHKKEMIDFASKMRKVNEIYYDRDGAAKIEFRFNIEENYKEDYEQ